MDRRRKPKKKKISKRRVNNAYGREEAVKREIVKLTKSVREKYRTLQRNVEDVEKYLEASAKPLVSPLQKTVVESIKQSMPLPMKPIKEKIIKKESTETHSEGEGSDDDGGELNKTVETSTQTETSLVDRYFKRHQSSAYRDKLDTTYGVRPDGKGGTLIGDSAVSFSQTKIKVKDKVFELTPGLMELLFMQVPKKDEITTSDVSIYKQILLMTNAHRQMYSAERAVNANKGKKYTAVIQSLFPPKHKTAAAVTSPATPGLSGSGLSNTAKDANALVNRLRLLYMSKNAGHSGHSREFNEIVNLLRMYKIIL